MCNDNKSKEINAQVGGCITLSMFVQKFIHPAVTAIGLQKLQSHLYTRKKRARYLCLSNLRQIFSIRLAIIVLKRV